MDNKKLVAFSRRKFIKGAVFSLVGLYTNHNRKLPLPIPTSITNQKRIYLAPDDHTDYFWSADETTYRQVFLDTLDYYLNQADATQNKPTQYQSRWNCDGSFWMWVYEKNKSSADFRRLVERIRDGHISVPINPLILCSGGAPAEAIIRGMYYSGKIERKYNLRFKLAYSIENQSLPLGLGSLWAGAGAKYSWKGICGCASMIPDAWDREHDIYWYTGLDNSRILMKWNSLLGNMAGLSWPNQGMGGYAEAYNPAGVVDYVDSNSQFIIRYPYQVIGAFGKGWDDLKTLTNEFVTIAETKSTVNRQVIVSNEQDFFEDFEATYGTSLPAISCSYGNEWELSSPAMAEIFARVRRSVEKLRGAEALAALVSLQNSNFMGGRDPSRDLAWMDLGLFWEHDMGGAPTIDLTNKRINWQKRLAQEIENYVNSLQSDAIIALGGMIQKSGSNLRIFAFNSLGWMRTDMADLPFSNPDPVHVIDLTIGQEIPSQIVIVDGERRLRILAKDIPAVGYKVFEIQPGAGQTFPLAASTNGNILENQYYKIAVDGRGAITSLIDKLNGNKELTNTIDGRAINDLGPGSGSIQSEYIGPVSVSLLANSNSILNHTTRFTLIKDVNRIEIKNEINQNFDSTYTWGFGFNLLGPDVWHEEVGAVIRAKLLANGGHYSPRNARYDWMTLNHFADISNASGLGVTLSNADCDFMKLGNSTPTHLDDVTPKLSVVAGSRDLNGPLDITNQVGESHFLQRFAIKVHSSYSPVDAMKFALEHQNPLVTGLITGGNGYPENSYSFLSIDNPNVLLWALKPADDGISQGIIARVWNMSANPASFYLALTPGPIQRAQATTHIETPIGPANLAGGQLAESLNQWQMKTYLLSLTKLNHRRYVPMIMV